MLVWERDTCETLSDEHSIWLQARNRVWVARRFVLLPWKWNGLNEDPFECLAGGFVRWCGLTRRNVRLVRGFNGLHGSLNGFTKCATR